MSSEETVERAPEDRGGRSRAPVLVALAAILLLAIGVRAWAHERNGRVLSRDGIRYAKIARALGEGRLAEALSNDYPPGFPATAAIAGRALGAASDRDFEAAAAWASALAGALSILPAFLLARRAAGSSAGLLAALALALHPHHVDASADVLSEPLMLLGSLSALAAGVAAAEQLRVGGPRGAAVLAGLSGLLAAGAFLARPEGILSALAPLALPGRRLPRAVATLAALALLAAPYVVQTSERAGALAITTKKDAVALVGSALDRPGEVASNALRNLGRAVESGQAAAVLATIGLVIAAARAGPRRRLAQVLAMSIVLFLAAESAVRVDPRFGLVLSTLAAPLAGVALDECAHLVAGALRSRSDVSPASRSARAGLAAALVLALASAPGVERATRPDRPHYRDCARAIEVAVAARGGTGAVILGPDPRIAHIAGDEGASDARGRPRLEPSDAARADVIVRFEGDPPAQGVRLRPIGRFDPPAGSRARALVADMVIRD